MFKMNSGFFVLLISSEFNNFNDYCFKNYKCKYLKYEWRYIVIS